MPDKPRKIGLHAAWAMAVGGMVGGGIFSALGIVLSVAGRWAPVSFLLAGVVAFITALNYTRLTRVFGEGGGAFTFLQEIKRERAADALAWVLIAGYTLTTGVYAFTFGHYLASAFSLGPVTARVAGVAIVVLLVAVNLLGVSQAAWVELVSVWGKLVILIVLAAAGYVMGSPARLFDHASTGAGPLAALTGAAVVFMAYEGFELLSYDYEEMRQPGRTLIRAEVLAVLSVIAVYLIVCTGGVMLVGADAIIQHEEVSISVMGERAFGTAGRAIAAAAAVLSTASAINATLFSTARLSRLVAKDHDLPGIFAKESKAGVPVWSVVVLGAAGATFAAVGSLTRLVEAASFTFLVTFAIVNALRALEVKDRRWLGWVGALLAGAAALVLAYRLITEAWWVLAVLGAVVAGAFLTRPLLLERAGAGSRPPADPG